MRTHLEQNTLVRYFFEWISIIVTTTTKTAKNNNNNKIINSCTDKSNINKKLHRQQHQQQLHRQQQQQEHHQQQQQFEPTAFCIVVIQLVRQEVDDQCDTIDFRVQEECFDNAEKSSLSE